MTLDNHLDVNEPLIILPWLGRPSVILEMIANGILFPDPKDQKVGIARHNSTQDTKSLTQKNTRPVAYDKPRLRSYRRRS